MAVFPGSEHVREIGLKGQDGRGHLESCQAAWLHAHFQGQGFLPARPALRLTAQIHLAAARQLNRDELLALIQRHEPEMLAFETSPEFVLVLS